MMPWITNDPLAPRQRPADPTTAPGPAYPTDAGHLVAGRRARLMDVGGGWTELDDVEATECFRLRDDAGTASSCNPSKDGNERCPNGRISEDFVSA